MEINIKIFQLFFNTIKILLKEFYQFFDINY
jgi:hypothetical protein